MKKFFALAAIAVLALASCSNNTLDTSRQKEISYNAVNAKNAVSRAIINTAFYAPTDPAFGIWGLYQPTDWATNHSSSVWVGTDAATEAQITYQTDTWKKAGTPDYWPLTGSLVFMGFSPYANVAPIAAISVADNKATLTVTNFQTTTGSWIDDLMYSEAVEKTQNDTNYDPTGANPTTYDGVPVVFHHALSQIAIYANTDKDYAAQGYTFTITALSVTVDDKATLTVTDDVAATPTRTATWTQPATDATRTVLSEASPALTTSFVKQGDSFLVIPQTLTAAQDIITITYQVAHNGVTSTKTTTINLTGGVTQADPASVTLGTFDINTKYNLKLTFSLTEIKYSPDIVDWTSEVNSIIPVPAN